MQEAFSYAGLVWEKYVEIDPAYFRPTEVDFLLGDASKARAALDWKPATPFKALVHMMVESDVRLAEDERLVYDQKYVTPAVLSRRVVSAG